MKIRHPARFAATIMTAITVLFSSATATEYAFVTTTDYSSGCASVIRLDPGYTTEICVAPIHSDAVARWYGGLVYVINRAGADNIQILDPEDGFATLSQHSAGNGTNPKDIAFVSPGKIFVSRYDSNDLLIMDPATGVHLGTIDLSQFADGDGLCEMDHMIMKDGILFVSIQRIDRNNYWMPVGDSYIAVVDAAADTLIDVDPGSPGVQAIPLSASNPFTDLKFDSDGYTILVGCVGLWGLKDGGIEMIDPVTMTSRGFMITETAAGGDINRVRDTLGRKGVHDHRDAVIHDLYRSLRSLGRDRRSADILAPRLGPQRHRDLSRRRALRRRPDRDCARDTDLGHLDGHPDHFLAEEHGAAPVPDMLQRPGILLGGSPLPSRSGRTIPTRSIRRRLYPSHSKRAARSR